VLRVVQPLLESKDMMAFATEPLRLSMANQLGRTENMAGERPTPMELHDIEVAIGMLQVKSDSLRSLF
jgi:hypothetical protein